MPQMETEHTVTVIIDDDDLCAIAAHCGQDTVTSSEVRAFLIFAIEAELAAAREDLAASLHN